MVNAGREKSHWIHVTQSLPCSLVLLLWRKREAIKNVIVRTPLSLPALLWQTQQRGTEIFSAARYCLLCRTTAKGSLFETPVGTWNKPLCCIAFITDETPSFLTVSYCQLPELVMRFMCITFNDILNPLFSSWIIWDLLLISANFRFILGVVLCVISQQISWTGGFHCVGAHKLWKPAIHQTGVTVGGEVTKMPCSFHPLTPSALAATLWHAKGEKLCSCSQH